MRDSQSQRGQCQGIWTGRNVGEGQIPKWKLNRSQRKNENTTLPSKRTLTMLDSNTGNKLLH